MDIYGRMLSIMIVTTMVAAVVIAYCIISGRLRADDKQEVKAVSLKADIKADLIANEGYALTVYRDTRGYKTAGIGHRLNDSEVRKYHVGDAVLRETVEQWFDVDIAKTMAAVLRYFPDHREYPQIVQLAIFNWFYQLGPDVPQKFPEASKYLRKRDWDKAADEWEFANPRTRRHSDWYRETPVRCRQEVGRLRHAARKE